MKQIIALTGRARSGKDTVADILVKHHGYSKAAFADKLKEGMLKLNPIVNPSERVQDVVSRVGWEKAKDDYQEIRRLLQVFGTEAGWQLHDYPELWPDTLKGSLGSGPTVITDLRFPGEREWATAHDIPVVAIIRDSVPRLEGKLGQHPSEAGISDPDYHILNNGSLEELRVQVDKFVRLLV